MVENIYKMVLLHKILNRKDTADQSDQSSFTHSSCLAPTRLSLINLANQAIIDQAPTPEQLIQLRVYLFAVPACTKKDAIEFHFEVLKFILISCKDES